MYIWQYNMLWHGAARLKKRLPLVIPNVSEVSLSERWLIVFRGCGSPRAGCDCVCMYYAIYIYLYRYHAYNAEHGRCFEWWRRRRPRWRWGWQWCRQWGCWILTILVLGAWWCHHWKGSSKVFKMPSKLRNCYCWWGRSSKSITTKGYFFSHNHGSVENDCIWKVTIVGTHFSLNHDYGRYRVALIHCDQRQDGWGWTQWLSWSLKRFQECSATCLTFWEVFRDPPVRRVEKW